MLAGKSLPFESPTDLLLHLIVHAAHDHGFNNGPLLMSDIAFLLRRHAIDWPLFWCLAGQVRSTRACFLALRLTERYWGGQPVSWPASALPPSPIDDTLLDTVALLTLRDAKLATHAQWKEAWVLYTAARFDDAARDAFGQYLSLRLAQPHFANARSVRNALDRARLAGEREAARARTDAARSQLAAADRRAQLARESRGFFDKSFRLGESDLPTRLRIEAEAADAERQAVRARIELAAAISAWRQALGQLPQ